MQSIERLVDGAAAAGVGDIRKERECRYQIAVLPNIRILYRTPLRTQSSVPCSEVLEAEGSLGVVVTPQCFRNQV